MGLKKHTKTPLLSIVKYVIVIQLKMKSISFFIVTNIIIPD